MNETIRKLSFFFTVALLGLILSAGTLHAQCTWPPNAIPYAYSDNPFWYTGPQGGPNASGLSAFICIAPGSCTQTLESTGVGTFSYSSGGYTITQDSPHIGGQAFSLQCDAKGNIVAWIIQVFWNQNYPAMFPEIFMESLGPLGPGMPGGDEVSLATNSYSSVPFGVGNVGFWIGHPTCAELLANSVTHQANGATMQATFAPPGGLQFTAGICGVDHFDWQQTINYISTPNAWRLLGPKPEPFFSPSLFSPPPPAFDPPPVGLIDPAPQDVDCKGKQWTEAQIPIKQSYPLYYSADEVQANGGFRTLSFTDTPNDACFSGNDPSGNPGAHIEFTTWLVGVDADGNPVDLPVQNSWNWLSTWDGTNGGAYGIKNLLPPDPGSGSGGTAILSVNGVPTRGPCANNATSLVAAKRGGYIYSMGTGRFTEMVTLTNTSAAPVTGPIALVLDNLTSGVSLENAAGATNCTEPVGSPYASAAGGLAPGQSVTLNLQFTDPAMSAISYTPRVLAGSAPQ